MLLFGLAIGRWWAIPIGALGWTILLLVGVPTGLTDLPVAAALGAANTAIGVGTRLALGLALRGASRITRLYAPPDPSDPPRHRPPDAARQARVALASP